MLILHYLFTIRLNVNFDFWLYNFNTYYINETIIPSFFWGITSFVDLRYTLDRVTSEEKKLRV